MLVKYFIVNNKYPSNSVVIVILKYNLFLYLSNKYHFSCAYLLILSFIDLSKFNKSIKASKKSQKIKLNKMFNLQSLLFILAIFCSMTKIKNHLYSTYIKTKGEIKSMRKKFIIALKKKFAK